MKQCNKCRKHYSEFFFRANGVADASAKNPIRRPTCMGCEQKAGDAKKKRNRWRVKAQDTIRRHAAKYGMSTEDFCEKYGWDVDQIAHDMEHAYKNGCWNCEKPYLDMGHGFADVTLDIEDPDLPPYYKTNVRIMCMTCNRKKHRTDPTSWAAQGVAWKQWAKHQDALNANPAIGTLFERTGFYGSIKSNTCDLFS